MAKLTVHAVAADTVASPGNANSLSIVVSVEDQNGLAVGDLGLGDFGVGSEIRPGGSIGQISSITNGESPGVYLIRLLPFEGQTWKAGGYIFSVSVNTGSDQGLTLCSLSMG